jgi:hypothetical protein
MHFQNGFANEVNVIVTDHHQLMPIGRTDSLALRGFLGRDHGR